MRGAVVELDAEGLGAGGQGLVVELLQPGQHGCVLLEAAHQPDDGPGLALADVVVGAGDHQAEGGEELDEVILVVEALGQDGRVHHVDDGGHLGLELLLGQLAALEALQLVVGLRAGEEVEGLDAHGAVGVRRVPVAGALLLDGRRFFDGVVHGGVGDVAHPAGVREAAGELEEGAHGHVEVAAAEQADAVAGQLGVALPGEVAQQVEGRDVRVVLEHVAAQAVVVVDGVAQLVAQHKLQLVVVEALEGHVREADQDLALGRRHHPGREHRVLRAEDLDLLLDAQGLDAVGDALEELGHDRGGQAHRRQQQVAPGAVPLGLRRLLAVHGRDLGVVHHRGPHVAVAVEDDQIEIEGGLDRRGRL